jgi:hypothetical protein
MNTNETAIVAPSALPSRWGYHACDHATYLKLKRLNHLIEQAKHLAAAQWRFDRKTINQGVRFEPICQGGRRVGRRRIDGAMPRPECPRPFTLVLLGHRRRPAIDHDWVAELFRAARTPSPVPAAALDAAALARAMALLEMLEAWWAAK